MSVTVPTLPEAVLHDLGLAADDFARMPPGAGTGSPVERLGLDVGSAALDAATAARIRASAESLTERGMLIVHGRGGRSLPELAVLRNALWPELHCQRVYRLMQDGVERFDVNGSAVIEGTGGGDGFVVACVRRVQAMAPDVTQKKFDARAAGWNGTPGSPQYGHFRWMRRLVAQMARPRRGERAIDAGSGAGWVGIEAALRGVKLCAFDPSPEMVRLVEQNARDVGVEVDATVGFVEDPPFPQSFDLVLNSGVISFAPDAGRFLDGLDRLVAPGGRLAIGDLNPRSRGFLRRRRERPVVPVRELNARTRGEVEAELARRGYEILHRRFYQITWPIPELGHRTRSHVVGWLLLQLNRAASALDAAFGSRGEGWFDSWILVARKAR